MLNKIRNLVLGRKYIEQEDAMNEKEKKKQYITHIKQRVM